MGNYILKRVLAVIPVGLVVGLVVFLLMHLIPGDPTVYMLGPEATDAELAQLRHELGLDVDLGTQFVRWMSKLVRGDLGRSIFLKQDVVAAIVQRLEPTVVLALGSLVIAVGIGVPAGIMAATHRGSWLDNLVQLLTPLGLAMPNFWLGLNLVVLFAVTWRLLPVAGYEPLSAGVAQTLKYMILPWLTLGLSDAAIITRMTRSAMLNVLHADYLRTARAKGLPRWRVVGKHALRNAAIPVITVVGMTLASLISGAVVTESIFNIPGVGKLFVESIFRRDYPVVQGVVLFTGIVYLLVNLLIDLSYVWFDPRVRYA